MKTIIAGCRDFFDLNEVVEAVKKSNFIITEVVSGRAKGVDTLGETWAKMNNIPIKPFPANWDKFGDNAGPLRNNEMAEYAEALIALWDGRSKGTHNMIIRAEFKKLKMYVHGIRGYKPNGDRLLWD